MPRRRCVPRQPIPTRTWCSARRWQESATAPEAWRLSPKPTGAGVTERAHRARRRVLGRSAPRRRRKGTEARCDTRSVAGRAQPRGRAVVDGNRTHPSRGTLLASRRDGCGRRSAFALADYYVAANRLPDAERELDALLKRPDTRDWAAPRLAAIQFGGAVNGPRRTEQSMRPSTPTRAISRRNCSGPGCSPLTDNSTMRLVRHGQRRRQRQPRATRMWSPPRSSPPKETTRARPKNSKKRSRRIRPTPCAPGYLHTPPDETGTRRGRRCRRGASAGGASWRSDRFARPDRRAFACGTDRSCGKGNAGRDRPVAAQRRCILASRHRSIDDRAVCRRAAVVRPGASTRSVVGRRARRPHRRRPSGNHAREAIARLDARLRESPDDPKLLLLAAQAGAPARRGGVEAILKHLIDVDPSSLEAFAALAGAYSAPAACSKRGISSGNSRSGSEPGGINDGWNDSRGRGHAARGANAV